MNPCMLSKTSFHRINCKISEPHLEAIDTFSSEYREFQKWVLGTFLYILQFLKTFFNSLNRGARHVV